MPQMTVNGIDVGQLNQAIETMRDRPELARFTFRARNRWVNGAHACTTIEDFHGAGHEDTSRAKPFVLEADEPAVLLGEDHGPNATEAALHALACCLNATFVYWAAAKKIPIEELELDLEGELDLRGFLGITDQVRNGYKDIRVTFHVKSDAPREQIQELVELAQKHSPVFDIVTHPTPVRASLELRE